MSNNSKVKVIDVNSEEVLFECGIDVVESAFEYAAQMEKLGIDIRILSPTITETLCDSLGIEHDERDDYENSVMAEIEDHDGSCCATPAEFTDGSKTTLQ